MLDGIGLYGSFLYNEVDKPQIFFFFIGRLVAGRIVL